MIEINKRHWKCTCGQVNFLRTAMCVTCGSQRPFAILYGDDQPAQPRRKDLINDLRIHRERADKAEERTAQLEDYIISLDASYHTNGERSDLETAMFGLGLMAGHGKDALMNEPVLKAEIERLKADAADKERAFEANQYSLSFNTITQLASKDAEIAIAETKLAAANKRVAELEGPGLRYVLGQTQAERDKAEETVTWLSSLMRTAYLYGDGITQKQLTTIIEQLDADQVSK